MATTKRTDIVVDEIHAVRQAMARAADFDVEKFAADLRKREQKHADRLVEGPLRPVDEAPTG